MPRRTVGRVVALMLVSASGLMAQGKMGTADIHITSRLPPMALHGTIVEMSCFKKLGAASVASPEAVACAKAALAAGGNLGILSEMDGVFKIVGAYADKDYTKVAPFIGKVVDMTGAEVLISNNYDYKAYEAKSIAAAKK